MTRHLWLAGLIALAGACSDTDDRPRTLAYVTESILAPSCGQAECHSTFTQEHGDIFDTVEASRRSMFNNELVYTCGPHGTDCELPQVIINGFKDPDGTVYRMPFDSPLPDNDLVLIEEWIKDGNAPGGGNGNGPEGVQCLSAPNDDSPKGCAADGVTLVSCVDGNITADFAQDCRLAGSNGGSCVEGACVATP